MTTPLSFKLLSRKMVQQLLIFFDNLDFTQNHINNYFGVLSILTQSRTMVREKW